MAITKPLADVDDIITQIYHGPLERKPWSSFLQALRLRFNADNSAMSLIPGKSGTKPHISVNRSRIISKSLAQDISKEHNRLTEWDILGNALKQPGDIFTLDDITPWSELKDNEFYLKVMKPSDVRYQLGMCFSEPSGWHCHVGLMNSAASGDFGSAEKDFLLALRPHLELALEFYALNRFNEMEKEIYKSTLDRLTVATFIVGGKGQVICSNRTADNLLAESRSLYLHNDELTLKRHNDNKQLDNLIQKALTFHQQTPDGTFVDALRIITDDDHDLGLLVRSVSSTGIHQSDASPCVIVYIDQSDYQEVPQAKFISQLLGLTPSEATLAILLSKGYTLIESAKVLEITENSVRTYIKTIFNKTGVSRQTDLVRLVLKSVALLA